MPLQSAATGQQQPVWLGIGMRRSPTLQMASLTHIHPLSGSHMSSSAGIKGTGGAGSAQL